MPSQADTPQKNSRRSRRNPRKSAGPTSSQTPTKIAAELSDIINPDKQSHYPTRILRRGDLENILKDDLTPPPQQNNPATPLRPSSLPGQFTHGKNRGNESAPETGQKKKAPKPQSRKHNSFAVPRSSELNDTSVSASRPVSLTPNRTTATPLKAYAGPTFHSSPAASSLPIPKFFSKSVPNVDKTTNMKAMVEQDTAETTSESDGSPFLENLQSSPSHRGREESPLDIFFRADREAKAKYRTESATNNSVRDPSNTGGSAIPNGPRHHSRHPTDTSVGGVFPLEMDGAALKSLTGLASTPIATNTSTDQVATNSAPVLAEADEEEERRKAQTLALKKLLYSQPQSPASPSSRSGTAISGIGMSNTPPAKSRNGTPERNQSFTPDRKTNTQPEGKAHDERHAALLALAQKQISPRGVQRPPTSNLRKEFTMPKSPGSANAAEPPATPTPLRSRNAPTAPIPKVLQDAYNSHITHAHSSASPQGGPDYSSRESANARSIEDDLRRILKIDIFGSDSVTGVRS